MCGIAGSYSRGNSPGEQSDVVERMVGSLRHRGPDAVGYLRDSPLSMGMARLSIIDVAGGDQPLFNEDGQVAVICNGEIYNHDILRKELESAGHRLATGSDVEVIAHLYEEHGDQCFSRLHGMYAVALWDMPRRRLVLARDRLGIKPLFYAIGADGAVMFASEIKAFRSAGTIPLSLDMEALDRYFTFGYVPAPSTIYKEIRRLPAGHLLICDESGANVQRFWQLPSPRQASSTLLEDEDALLGLLRNAVRSQLMSEVPLGAFLSGGIDSSLIVALMSQESSAPVRTFTLGFSGHQKGYLDERVYAREISAQYGTVHTELEVSPEFETVLDEIVEAFDEPFADDSVIPSYYICKLARQHVTVALTGLGGDELFGGYERYLGMHVSSAYGRLPSFLRARAIPALVGKLPDRDLGPMNMDRLKRFVKGGTQSDATRYLGYLSVVTPELKNVLYAGQRWPRRGAELDTILTSTFDSASDAVDAALRYDLLTYLPDDVLALTDRLSMQHSLELRVPFLDEDVVSYAAALPSDLKVRGTTKKFLLRRVASRFLPPSVMNHRKQGFASPMAQWLRTGKEKYIRDALSPQKIAAHGLFDSAVIATMVEQHLAHKESHYRALFTLLMFQKWFERFR